MGFFAKLRSLFSSGPAPGQVDAAEARRLQQEERAVLLDVREPAEWRAGHAKGARHVPLGKLAVAMKDLPRDVPVVVVCASGARSAMAARRLGAAGFTRVHNLRGGMAAWRRAGLPMA